MVSQALQAAELLKADGIKAEVIDMSHHQTVRRRADCRLCHETGAIVTAEEHSVIGGLGSSVAECVCERCPVPVLRVGIEDQFGRSGSVPALLEAYGLTPGHIAEKARAAVGQKKPV